MFLVYEKESAMSVTRKDFPNTTSGGGDKGAVLFVNGTIYVDADKK